MARKPLVVYDDFHGGEWGLLGPKLAAKNQFSGRNVLVYADGQIGPRAGIVDYQFDATAPINGPRTKPVAIGRRPGDNLGWFAWVDSLGNMQVETFTHLTAPATLSAVGPFPATTHPVGVIGQSYDQSDGLFSYYATRDGIWRVDWTANTNQKIAGSPPRAEAFAHYGDRFISGHANELRYSAPGNAFSWPAANTITVGESNIRGLYVVRGSLVIVMDDYGIWRLTGVPGVNEYLTEVVPRYEGDVDKFDYRAADVERGSRLWMTLPGRLWPGDVTPIIFGGSAITREWPEFEIDAFRGAGGAAWSLTTGGSIASAVQALGQSDDVAIIGGAGNNLHVPAGLTPVMLRHNGVWSAHFLNWPDAAFGLNQLHLGNGRVVAYADNTAGGAVPPVRAYSWKAAVDQVPVAQADHMSPIGDANNVPIPAHFDLSEFWLPDGQEMTVQEILVDATIFDIANTPNTGIAQIACGCNVTVQHVGVSGGADSPGAGDAGSGVNSISANATPIATGSLPTLSRYAGERRSFKLSVEPLSSRAFQLKFDSMVGMSIRRVTVIGDVDPPR